MAVTQTVPSEVYGSSPHPARFVDVVYLSSSAAVSYVAPATATYAIITSDNPFFLRVGSAAAVPGAGVTDGTGSQYYPAGVQLRIEGGVTYSFIRAGSSTTTVTIGCYK